MASKQRGSRVSDQKQEVKEEQMSKQATMVLMKNLVRSISHNYISTLNYYLFIYFLICTAADFHILNLL